MNYPTITLPPEIEGHEVIASVSGGKDSTALMLALREAGIPFRAVFADTGWEHPAVYEYLDLLRERIGPIDVVRAAFDEALLAATLRELGVPEVWVSRLSTSAMVARCLLGRAGFPARVQRWCTRELKIEPLRDHALAVERETGRPSVSAVGVRADESAKRQALLGNAWGGELEREAEGPSGWGHWVWRPVLRWTAQDAFRIHLANDIPINPLYKRGHDRVGCWPCIHSKKEEIRMLDDDRVEIIRILEAAISELRQRRNVDTPGRYAWESATFFQGREDSPLGTAPSIDTLVAWSRTSRGGRQLVLIDDGPRGGCLRYGLCDTGDGR